MLALLKYKPAPFYILDEVDSALDLSHTENIGIIIANIPSQGLTTYSPFNRLHDRPTFLKFVVPADFIERRYVPGNKCLHLLNHDHCFNLII